LVVDLSELLPNALLSTRADAIVAADREGVIRFWNPGAERIFGHRAADAIGQSLDLIIPERLRQRHWAGYGRTMQTGESRYGDGDFCPCLHDAMMAPPFRLNLQSSRSRTKPGTWLGWPRSCVM
jgi:PAS domain-containing protein